jgi:anti-anti-sigma factor
VSQVEGPAIALGVEHDGQGAVVTVNGELEFGTAAILRTTLLELAQEGCERVVLDISGLEFIDSTGVSLLVQAKQRLESQGHQFVLRAPAHRVLRVLEIAGLAELFTIE